MADSINPVEVRIDTTATGDGAEKSAAGLTKVTQAANYLTQASAMTEQEALAAAAAIQTLTEQVTALEAKKAAILGDRTPRIIDATTAPGAAASPDNQVAAINREIAATEAEILATKNQIAGITDKQVVTEEQVAEMKATAAKIDAESAVEKELELTKLAKQASIEGEIVALRAAQKELSLAKAAGDDLQVEKLKAEIDVRRMTVVELQQELSTRSALMEIEDGQAALLNETLETINARVAARQLELETMEAQEALNAELIEQEEARLAIENEIIAAQEELNAALVEQEAAQQAAAAAEEKVYGMRNRYASLLKNFGIDQNIAASAGIGLFAGYEVYEHIHRATEELEKANEARDKANAKELESHEHAMREIEDLDSLAEAQRRRAATVEKLNDALDDQRNLSETATDAQRSQLDSHISNLEVEIAQIDRVNERTIEREDAARKVKEQEEATRDALNEQLKALDREGQANSRRLEFEKQKNALIAENAIKQLELDAATGKITPEEAARQREAITGKRDNDNFAASQKQLNDEIGLEEKKAKTASDAADKEHAAQVESATRAQEEAVREADALQQKFNDAARLEEAARVAAKAASDADTLFSMQQASGDYAGDDLESMRRTKEAADQKAADAQKIADDARKTGGPGSALEAATATAKQTGTDLEKIKNSQDALEKTNRDTAAASSLRIAELKEQIKYQTELNAKKLEGDQIDSKLREAKAAAEEKKKQEEAEKKELNDQLNDFRTGFETIRDKESGQRQSADYKAIMSRLENWIKSHQGVSDEVTDAAKRLDDGISHALSENEKRKSEIKQLGRHVKYNSSS